VNFHNGCESHFNRNVTKEETAMPRITGVSEQKANIFVRLAYWFSRKRVGKVVEPLAVSAHHPWIFRGYGAYEFALERAHFVEGKLKALASIKAATLVGCPF
jgi:hypothetical protein